jgi:hypothetical protein
MSSGETVGVVCPHCGRPSAAELVGGRQPADADGRMEMLWCGQCEGALLVWRDYEYVARSDGTYWMAPTNTRVVWPMLDRELNEVIPEELRRLHEEARKCFHATAYAATAAMVRRAIEAMCNQQGAKGRDLKEKVGDLGQRGLVDSRLIEWMQTLRLLGNSAVHSADDVDRKDARDALDLAEAVLDYVYVFTARFDAFRARRSSQ